MAEGADNNHVLGTDRTPGGNISSINFNRLKNEDASLELSNLLNMMGYGKELRQKRREYCREKDILWNAKRDMKRITVGSKAEGLSRYFESDWDFLIVLNVVECLENGYDVNMIPENTPVFRMDTEICYPGHCILLLERGFPLVFLYALRDNGHGKVVLSSEDLQNIRKKCSPILERPFHNDLAGPSLPFSLGPFSVDTVFALRCRCPSILQRWASRSRHWPPRSIVDKVVSMGALLTPVGFKGSENKQNEWRICFNTGETELIINLNDTQVKLYLLLKMIAKDVLKPRHKEITSYMLKSIVLWLAEKNLQSMFHERSLFFWLHESLLELRNALLTKQLPYYMIPERNLMAATGLTDAKGRTWAATITDMMDEGAKLIRRLPKIRQAIIAHPQPLLWYNTRKIELEIVWLEISKAFECWGVTSFGTGLNHLLRSGLFLRYLEIMRDVLEKMRSEESADTYNYVGCLNAFNRLLM